MPPPSILKQIADALVVKSQSISGIGATGKNPKAWYEELNTPAAYVCIATESKSRGPTASMTGRAVFFYHCIVSGENRLDLFLDLYQAIEEKIGADPRLGGLVQDAVVAGAEMLVTTEAIAQQKHVADVFIEVEYRHPKGAP